MEQVYTITYATIWNPGGGNFQESRISERGLVRAFFADACVSFQLVNNTRESASIAFTFAARPRSAVEKYRWIRYPVGQVPVAQLPRARALILSSLFAIASFQVYRVYQEGASCSNWRWSPIETAFTQSTSAATTTNFARYFFLSFFLSLSLAPFRKCNKRRPRSRRKVGRWRFWFNFFLLWRYCLHWRYLYQDVGNFILVFIKVFEFAGKYSNVFYYW